MFITSFFDTGTTGLLFIIVLGVLIFVHEFGHFIFAKKSGVRVERFSLGFGPPLWRRQWNETEYRISAIPLGGYVKMYGENSMEEVVEPARSFLHQSVWKRIPIVAAGPLFNAFFAIILIAIIHLVGMPVEKSVQIGRVLEHSAAAQADLQTDDIIISINNEPVQRIHELKSKILASEGTTLQLKVRRQKQEVPLQITPRRDQASQEWRIGVELRPGEITVSRSNPAQALWQGTVWTWRITKLTFLGFGQIISGAIPASESLAGPLGIAREIGRQADNGWRNVVFLTAGISVSLAILNLLPIPVLDGGHLLFFAIEVIKGSPLSLRKREFAQQVGLVLLACLMLFAFYNDLMNLFFQN
jgi:regulator of sigma E protease